MAISSRTPIQLPNGSTIGEEIVVAWTSNGSGAATVSIPEMVGYLLQMITVPSDSPTDNYDITLVAPQGSGLDILGGVGADRDTANTEAVAVYLSSAPTPPFLNGTYTFTVANAGDTKSGTATLILNYGVAY